MGRNETAGSIVARAKPDPSSGDHPMRVPFPRRLLVAIMLATAPAAHAADSMPGSDAPDLRGIRADLKAKRYDVALLKLRPLAAAYEQPDVYSLMGFALRKTGDRPNAMRYYNQALTMNPSHKGALEYQGELFVELGQVDSAKGN